MKTGFMRKLYALLVMATLTFLLVGAFSKETLAKEVDHYIKIAGTMMNESHAKVTIGGAVFQYDSVTNTLTVSGCFSPENESGVSAEALIDIRGVDDLALHFEKDTIISTNQIDPVYIFGSTVTISSGDQVQITRKYTGNQKSSLDLIYCSCSNVTFHNTDMTFVCQRGAHCELNGGYCFSVGVDFTWSKIVFDHACLSVSCKGSRVNTVISAYDSKDEPDFGYTKICNPSEFDVKDCKILDNYKWYYDAESTFGNVVTTNNSSVPFCIIESPSFDVSFDMNGVTSVTAPKGQHIRSGKTATEPAIEAPAGLNFGGWYTDASCTKKFDFATPVTDHIKLYACWQVTVRFDPNGALPDEWPKDQTILRNTAATHPADPKSKGDVFLGWYSFKDSDVPFDFSEVLTKNTVIYAKWQLHTHSVSKVSEKPASETQEGCKGHYQCDICGKLFLDEAATKRVEESELIIPKITASAVTNGKPAKVSLSAPKNKKPQTLVIKWKKTEMAEGYEVQYSLKKNFKKNTKKKSTAKLSLTVKKLKKGKTYYIRVRAFKKDVAGKKVYGKWSKVKAVKVKR